MVVSLDADKAFDRIEWDFLIFTLKTLGLSEIFLKNVYRLGQIVIPQPT